MIPCGVVTFDIIFWHTIEFKSVRLSNVDGVTIEVRFKKHLSRKN